MRRNHLRHVEHTHLAARRAAIHSFPASAPRLDYAVGCWMGGFHQKSSLGHQGLTLPQCIT